MAPVLASPSRPGRTARALGTIVIALLVATLAVAFAAASAPRAAAQEVTATSAATLTIHNRICPAGFEGPDYYGACHDNPQSANLPFIVAGPEGRELPTDAAGNVTFANLPVGTYTVSGGPPGDFADVVVYCAPASAPGTAFPFQYVGGGYQISIALGAGDNVVCDWYNTVVPQGPTTATLTIRGQLCPKGYTGTAYFSACTANVPAGTEYTVAGPDSATLAAGAAGTVTFADLTAPGTYQVRGGIPGEFARLVVDCTVANPPYQSIPFTPLGGGVRGPNDVTGLQITLGIDAEVVCSFYNIPEDLSGASPSPKPSASASARPSASAAPVVTLPNTGAGGTGTGTRLQGVSTSTLLLILATGGLAATGLALTTRRRRT